MALGKEQAEQINIVNWFNYQYPELKDDLHHFANERKCSVQTGRTLKRMGVKKGVADFFLAVGCDGFFGLWIELKVGKGKLSPEQITFLERKNSKGYLALSVWGFDAAKELITAYLHNYNKNSPCNAQKPLYN